MSLINRMESSTFAAEYSGHYLICFSLTDKINYLLLTQPRQFKHRCRRNVQQFHLFPTPTWKCMLVIHHILDTSQLHFKKAALLLIKAYPIALSPHVLQTLAMLTGDKHTASGCTLAPVTACFIFILSFWLSLQKQ